MPQTDIVNFDGAKIPDPTDELNFHANAAYVFAHLANVIIPGINANLQWVDGALDGDTQTLLDSMTSLQASIAATTSALSGKLDSGAQAADSAKLGGSLPSAFATAGHSHNGSNLSSINIPIGENLDTYTTPGVYRQTSNSQAAAGSNYPADYAGVLTVSVTAGVTQTYLTYANTDQRMYYRGQYSGTWSAWREVTVEDEVRNTWGGLKSQTAHGYIWLGPSNTSHAHIYTDRASFYFDKPLLRQGNTVWDAGNDGSGSGMDADLLDGQHGGFYRNAGNLDSGTVPIARLPLATEGASGIVERATQAEAEAGAENFRYMSPLRVRQAIDDRAVFTREYDSGELVPVGQGTAVLTHGLGGVPKFIQASLICKTAQGGYSVGDEVAINNSVSAANAVSFGQAIILDHSSTQIKVQYGFYAQWEIPQESNGAIFQSTPGYWNLRIRAFR